MSQSISVSSENKSILDMIRKPGETYDDVIEMLIEDYKINYEEWADRAKEAWEEHKRGESITLEDMKKRYGIE